MSRDKLVQHFQMIFKRLDSHRQMNMQVHTASANAHRLEGAKAQSALVLNMINLCACGLCFVMLETFEMLGTFVFIANAHAREHAHAHASAKAPT